MKKFLVILCAISLVFCVANSANAIPFTNTVDVGDLYGADSGGHIWQGFEPVTYTWEHTMPTDFEVPWDVVNSASISVYVGWVDTVGDDHFDVGNYSLTLSENTATYSLSDIADLFITWPNGQNLSASLVIWEDEGLIGHPEWNGDIILGDSVFTMDYDNGTAPVPEPATILLMGTGLLGMMGFGRKRLNKKA